MCSFFALFCFIYLPLLPDPSAGTDQEIHKLWPFLRDPIRILSTLVPNNNQSGFISTHTQYVTRMRKATPNAIPKTLVYGSPICIGRCIIFQIFWSNSTSSVLCRKIPRIPTFPRPREKAIDKNV